MRITGAAIKKLPTPKTGARIWYDDEVKGFGVRKTAAGVTAFILNYRVSSRERRYTIGRWPDWSAEAARDEAIELRKGVSKGVDPLRDREKRATAPTVAELCDEYLEQHARPHKRPSSVRRDEDLIKNVIKAKLGRDKVAEITRRDIERLHQSLKDTPYQANRTLALLSKMFSLAAQWEMTDRNPCKGIPRFQEEKRERYLTNDELKRLITALSEYPRFTTKKGEARIDARKEQSTNVIRLLLLTGARRGEVLGMQWDHLDLAAGVWTKPSAHTKQKKVHRVPLSAPARQLLTEIHDKKHRGAFVFPGPEGHQVEIKKAWQAICELADLAGLRIHDLRHSYASQLASAGLSLPVIGALLGHTQPATTARYAHLLDDPLREATERVGAVISNAENGKTADVVPLRDKDQ